MAEDKKISELEKLVELNGDEQIPVAKDGKNYSIALNQIGGSGGGGDFATKNELDVIETLAESVNKGLGETIQRVEALESGLEADKTNLKNFKQNVEDNYVLDADYNKDKEVIAGQIMSIQQELSALRALVENAGGSAR